MRYRKEQTTMRRTIIDILSTSAWYRAWNGGRFKEEVIVLGQYNQKYFDSRGHLSYCSLNFKYINDTRTGFIHGVLLQPTLSNPDWEV